MSLAVVGVILAASAATGCARWTRRDTAMELGFAALTMTDWAQTRGIVRVCGEQNPIIGTCGDNMPVPVYFPVTMLLHAGVAAVLPPKWRTAWQGLGIGAELNQTWSNYRNGYTMYGTVED